MTEFANIYQKDKHFLELVEQLAVKSPCIRDNGKVAALAEKDGDILVTATNGEVGGISCKQLGYCIRTKKNIASGTRREIAYCICAEQKLIIEAMHTKKDLSGSTVYVNIMPCSVCLRLLCESGVKRIVFKHDYSDKFSLELEKMLPIEFVQFEDK